MESDTDDTGRFLPGNRMWDRRKTPGRDKKFEAPDDLWAACCGYFDYVAENPLYEAKAFAFQGAVTQDNLPKMRAMSIKAMCLHIGVAHQTWDRWKNEESDLFRPDLSSVMGVAEDIIFSQKFEGASADLLNANIIARDLGLADKKEVSGEGGGPIETKDVSDMELARRMAFILASGLKEDSSDDSQPG